MMASKNGAMGLGAALLISGCVAVQDPPAPGVKWDPPAGARAGSSASWREIRARTVDPAKPVVLRDAVELALHNSPATRKAWNEARVAVAQVRQAEGYFVPSLTAVAQGERRRVSAFPDGYNLDYLHWGPGLQINYLIFNFGGGRQAAVEQALQTVYAARFQGNRAIQDTVLAAELAYYAALGAQSAVAAAEAEGKEAGAVLDAARTRRDAGLGVDLDVIQAQAALERARYSLAAAEGRRDIARGQLAQAMGLPPDTPFTVAEPDAGLPAELAEPDLRRMIDAALERRPDLAALRAAVAARESAVRVAGSPGWPSLYFTGNAGRDDYDTYAGKKFQDHDWAFAGALTLQWTIFDGNQTANARRAAAAQADAARAQLQQAELAASGEVWARFHAYGTARRKYRFGESYYQSALAAQTLALESYRSGVKSVLDLLTADKEAAQARVQLAAAREEVFSALAQLAHALGVLDGASDKPLPDFANNPTTPTKDGQR